MHTPAPSVRSRRSRRSRLILLPVVAALAAGCVGPPAVEGEGRLQRIVVDRFDRGESRIEYELEGDGGRRWRVQFDGDPGVQTGAWLKVAGDLLAPDPAGGLEVIAARRFEVRADHEGPAARGALIVPPGALPAPRSVAIVLFNFQNDDRQPISTDEVRRRILTDANSVRAFFKEQSYGHVDFTGKRSPDGDVFGWYTLPTYNRPCDERRWSEAALGMAGLTWPTGVPTDYDHYVFLFPYTDACLYGGRGQLPGRVTWINGASIRTMAHEFGHNLRGAHASASICTDASGARITLGQTCRTVEYGNPFDIMGHAYRHTNALNKYRAGWLDGQRNVLNVPADGVYTLVAQERPSNDVQLLSTVRSETDYYYVEYRQPFGYDDFLPTSPAVTGVMLLIGGTFRQTNNTLLLDTNPATTTFADAPLGVGKSFADPAAGVTITLVEATAAAAKVKFEFRGGANMMMIRDAGAVDAAGDARPGTLDGRPGDAAEGGAGAGPDGAAGGNGAAPVQGGQGGGGQGGQGGQGGGGQGGGAAPPQDAARDRAGPAPAPPPPVAAGPDEAGGCQCRVAPGGGRGGGLPFALPMLAMAVVLGRRRRRRPAAALALALVVAGGWGCQGGGDGPPEWTPPDAQAGTGAGGRSAGGRAGTSSGGAGGGGATGEGGAAAGAPGSGGAAGDAAPGGPADGPAGDRAPAGDAGPAVARVVLAEAPAAIVEACRAHASAYCARYLACAPVPFANNWGDEAYCRGKREQACRLDLLTPGRAETPAQRTACAVAVGRQSCRDFWFGRPLAACNYPPGTLKRGEACTRSSQCGPELSCEIPTDEACGVCEPTLSEGDDCSFWSAGCPQGMACYADQCLAPRAAAQACKMTPAPCLSGMACAAGGCVEKNGDVGADCSRLEVCDPMKALYCDITTGKCAANPPPVAAGQPCNVVNAMGVRSRCADGVTCFAPASAPTRPTCIPKVDAGQPCDSATGVLCKPPAECFRGRCAVPVVVTEGPATFRACP
jgi:hypothetical protein